MKNKVVSVVKYTVTKSIRNKWFVILNILFFAITMVALNFSTVKEIFKSKDISFDKDMNIIVYDNENLIYGNLETGFSNNENTSNVKLQKEEVITEYTNETLNKDTIVIEVNPSEENIIDTKIISKEGIDNKYYSVITNAIKEAKYTVFENKYSVSKDMLNKVTSDPVIDRVTLGIDSSNSDQKQGIQMISTYLIFIVLMIVLSKVANDISQEKISKSIEYILTSMSAKGYLIAKILSTNLTLIIQLVFNIVYFIIAMLANNLLNIYFLNPNFTLDTGAISSNIYSIIDSQMLIYIGVIFVYMVVTMLILSVVQAALSSKTTDIVEAGNATILLLTLNMVMYFLTNFAIGPLKEPNIIIYIISCLPIASMYFIPTMLLIGQATILQVAISTVILFISVPLVFNFSANIFKNGVLDYTNKKVKKDKRKKELTIEEIQNKIISKNEYRKFGFVIGFSLILFIVLQLIFSYLLMPFSGAVTKLFNGILTSDNIYTIFTMVTFIISLVVPAMFINIYTNKEETYNKKIIKPKWDRSFGKYLRYAFMATPIVLIVQIVVSQILEKLGLNYDILEKFNIYNNTSTISNILFFIETAILPAIFEELYIRKAVFNFSKKYGYLFAVIFSSILFAVIHMNISQGLFAFIMGVILCIVTIKSKSIIPAMIIHFLNNGYAALTTIFENNSNMLLSVNVIYLFLILLGIYFTVKDLIYKKKNKIKIINIEKNVINKSEYKYIFSDYVSIISIILVILMLIVTQNMINVL
jgi:membrane protease YdiL (CAAX protease family)